MLKPRTLVTSLIAALALLSSPALAVEAGRYDTVDFAEVRKVIDTAIARVGADKVLVVFDIDNTMMATDIDLGSEHWYMWQAELIQQGVGAAGGAVAATIDDLNEVNTWVNSVTTMRPTDPTLPDALRAYADRGIQTIAITSRNPEMRDSSLRELRRANIDLGRNAPGPKGGYPGQFKPTEDSAPVIYEEGMMLTQGQNKGKMLVALLAKTGARPAAIVFMDDRPHHLDGMQAAFKDRSELVYTVRYDHEREVKAKFFASDKAAARAQWCSLSQAFQALRNNGTERQGLSFLACVKP